MRIKPICGWLLFAAILAAPLVACGLYCSLKDAAVVFGISLAVMAIVTLAGWLIADTDRP